MDIAIFECRSYWARLQLAQALPRLRHGKVVRDGRVKRLIALWQRMERKGGKLTVRAKASSVAELKTLLSI